MTDKQICCVCDTNSHQEDIKIKWEDLSRFEGMKLVEIAVSNFGYIYARFDDQDIQAED